MLNGQIVLVTGGTGSFGNTFVRHLLHSYTCKEIRVFSRDEGKQDSLRNELDDKLVSFFIGDIRDRQAVDYAMRGVHSVFHAAALKQVPSCDFFPMEAVDTNIVGSSNVMSSATEFGVERLICLSTDKAVMPINAMGMTKALMEKIVLSKARRYQEGDTKICCVRYGNVMYSRGSVIPRFIDQIRRGRPITITDPHMTRFLLPLQKSVALVESALASGRPGDIFVMKSPASTTETLVQALIELFDANNPVRVIGPRHGEKVYETLVTAEELSRADDMGEFYRIALDSRDLNYDSFFLDGSLKQLERDDYTSRSAVQLDVKQTKELLVSLPEIRRELRLD